MSFLDALGKMEIDIQAEDDIVTSEDLVSAVIDWNDVEGSMGATNSEVND